MTERYGFSSGEDDPASRRGPGVTGQRGDEPPSSPQRADVREIDLTEDDEDDEDERDLADAEAAERVERLREATREEGDGRATVLFPPADDRDDDAERPDEAADDAADEAPQAYGVGAPVAEAADEDEQDQDEDEEEASAGTTLAPATPLPRSDEAAAAQVEGGEPEAPSAGTAVASADATPAPRSGALLATDAEAVRRQFLDIQAGFVDEPRQAVEQAGELVEALHQKVLESLHAEREQLDDALAGEEQSTEELRVALRAYRAYVDRLLGLHL